MTDADIEGRFPGVKILRHRSAEFHVGRVGWGVELDGRRNAWLFPDTPEDHEAARLKAVKWLEEL